MFCRGKQKKRGPTVLARVLDGIVVVLTCVGIVALFCAYMARWVNPNTAWIFAFAGMAAPAIYVLNLIAALYWVVKWRGWFFLPALTMLFGVGLIPTFFKPELSRHHGEPPVGAVKVVSYNVEGFRGGGGEMTAFIESLEADILCVQEYESATADREKKIDSLIGLPFSVHSYSHQNSSGGGLGVAIFSRWRIIDSGEMHFARTTNSAMWVDVVNGKDTLRIFNCHLQSTSVSREDVAYVEDFVAEQNERHTRNIASKLRRGFRMRANQVDSLAPLVRDSPYQTIVCGDFNDTPVSYAYTRIRGRLKDTFVEKGRGAPSTYRGLFDILRIDYIFHSRSMRTVGYEIPNGGSSDHRPVTAEIIIR